MPTVFIDQGDGTTKEFHVYYLGLSGPFLIPVGATIKDETNTDVEALPLRTSNQLYVGSAPTDPNHVARKSDLLPAIISELYFGISPTKYWRIKVDPVSHNWLIQSSQDNGATWITRTEITLIP